MALQVSIVAMGKSVVNFRNVGEMFRLATTAEMKIVR